MRTLQYYNFTVSGTLNLTSLRPEAPTIVADDGPVVAVQIVACELGRAGFCSPFIHEEANARINAKLLSRQAARGGERRLKFQPGDRHGGAFLDVCVVWFRIAGNFLPDPHCTFLITRYARSFRVSICRAAT